MIKFIVIFLIFFSAPCLSTDLSRIYYLDIDQLIHSDDCLENFYFNSISGTRELKICSEKKGSPEKYYEYLANYNKFLFHGNFRAASSVLMKISRELKLVVGNAGIDLIDSKANMLAKQENTKSISDAVTVEKRDSKFYITHSSSEFLFDSGSLFSFIRDIDCARRDAAKQVVLDSNGIRGNYESCTLTNDLSGSHYIVGRSNVLGILDSLSYGKIIFDEEKRDPGSIYHLFFDNDIMFVRDYYVNNSGNVLGIVSCLDTGSNISFATKKFYKKIKTDFKEKTILSETKISSFNGEKKTFGVRLNDFNTVLYRMDNILAIPHEDMMMPCDIVLGNDFLYDRLLEISFEKRHVKFK